MTKKKAISNKQVINNDDDIIKEVQLDLPEAVDPLLQAQADLENANILISKLQAENVKLFEQANLEPMVSTLESTLTRNDVIKALLPQIRPVFAESDISLTSKTADAICFAFGIK